MKLLIITALIAIVIFGYLQLNKAGDILKVGDKAPDFNLLDAKGQAHQLSDYANQWLVLYFYPKDDTPGCTKEACHFRDDLQQLDKLGAKVVGVSVDDGISHTEFSKKYNLTFPLLSDTDGLVADKYGALTNLGLVKIAKRYTFLINPKGNIAKTYLSVDTSRHSQEIIDDLKKLSEH
jgi:thioredoxin-dependent peroxiredoxin